MATKLSGNDDDLDTILANLGSALDQDKARPSYLSDRLKDPRYQGEDGETRLGLMSGVLTSHEAVQMSRTPVEKRFNQMLLRDERDKVERARKESGDVDLSSMEPYGDYELPTPAKPSRSAAEIDKEVSFLQKSGASPLEIMIKTGDNRSALRSAAAYLTDKYDNPAEQPKNYEDVGRGIPPLFFQLYTAEEIKAARDKGELNAGDYVRESKDSILQRNPFGLAGVLASKYLPKQMGRAVDTAADIATTPERILARAASQPFIDLYAAKSARNSLRRLQADEYDQPNYKGPGRAEDISNAREQLRPMMEAAIRGGSLGRELLRGISEQVPYMVEFFVTAPLKAAASSGLRGLAKYEGMGTVAEAAKRAGSSAVKKTIEKASQESWRKGVVEGAKAMGRGGLIQTVASPHRVASEFQKRRLPIEAQLTPEGELAMRDPEEAGAMTLAKVIVGQTINNATEHLSEPLDAAVGPVQKRAVKMFETFLDETKAGRVVRGLWDRYSKSTVGASIDKFRNAVAFGNIPSEWMEEKAAALASAVVQDQHAANPYDRRPYQQRLIEDLAQTASGRQNLIELGIITATAGAIGGVRAAGMAMDRPPRIPSPRGAIERRMSDNLRSDIQAKERSGQPVTRQEAEFMADSETQIRSEAGQTPATELDRQVRQDAVVTPDKARLNEQKIDEIINTGNADAAIGAQDIVVRDAQGREVDRIRNVDVGNATTIMSQLRQNHGAAVSLSMEDTLPEPVIPAQEAGERPITSSADIRKPPTISQRLQAMRAQRAGTQGGSVGGPVAVEASDIKPPPLPSQKIGNVQGAIRPAVESIRQTAELLPELLSDAGMTVEYDQRSPKSASEYVWITTPSGTVEHMRISDHQLPSGSKGPEIILDRWHGSAEQQIAEYVRDTIEADAWRGTQKPVSQAVVEKYGIELPGNYVLEGDTYVAKGQNARLAVPEAGGKMPTGEESKQLLKEVSDARESEQPAGTASIPAGEGYQPDVERGDAGRGEGTGAAGGTVPARGIPGDGSDISRPSVAGERRARRIDAIREKANEAVSSRGDGWEHWQSLKGIQPNEDLQNQPEVASFAREVSETLDYDVIAVDGMEHPAIVLDGHRTILVSKSFTEHPLYYGRHEMSHVLFTENYQDMGSLQDMIDWESPYVVAAIAEMQSKQWLPKDIADELIAEFIGGRPGSEAMFLSDRRTEALGIRETVLDSIAENVALGRGISARGPPAFAKKYMASMASDQSTSLAERISTLRPAVRTPITDTKARFLGVIDNPAGRNLIEVLPQKFQGVGNAAQFKARVDSVMKELSDQIADIKSKIYPKHVDMDALENEIRDAERNGVVDHQMAMGVQRFRTATSSEQRKEYASQLATLRNEQRRSTFKEWQDYLATGGYSTESQILILNAITHEFASRDGDRILIGRYSDNSSKMPLTVSPVLGGAMGGAITNGPMEKPLMEIAVEAQEAYAREAIQNKKTFVPPSATDATRGEWKMFPWKRKDPENFARNVADLQAIAATSSAMGNTPGYDKMGWCTGRGAARQHLTTGDFWVYVVNDKARVAVRMEGERDIGEIRGILVGQGMEPEFASIANDLVEKMGFEGGREFVTENLLKQELAREKRANTLTRTRAFQIGAKYGYEPSLASGAKDITYEARNGQLHRGPTRFILKSKVAYGRGDMLDVYDLPPEVASEVVPADEVLPTDSKITVDGDITIPNVMVGSVYIQGTGTVRLTGDTRDTPIWILTITGDVHIVASQNTRVKEISARSNASATLLQKTMLYRIMLIENTSLDIPEVKKIRNLDVRENSKVSAPKTSLVTTMKISSASINLPSLTKAESIVLAHAATLSSDNLKSVDTLVSTEGGRRNRDTLEHAPLNTFNARAAKVIQARIEDSGLLGSWAQHVEDMDVLDVTAHGVEDYKAIDVSALFPKLATIRHLGCWPALRSANRQTLPPLTFATLKKVSERLYVNHRVSISVPVLESVGTFYPNDDTFAPAVKQVGMLVIADNYVNNTIETVDRIEIDRVAAVTLGALRSANRIVAKNPDRSSDIILPAIETIGRLDVETTDSSPAGMTAGRDAPYITTVKAPILRRIRDCDLIGMATLDAPRLEYIETLNPGSSPVEVPAIGKLKIQNAEVALPITTDIKSIDAGFIEGQCDITSPKLIRIGSIQTLGHIAISDVKSIGAVRLPHRYSSLRAPTLERVGTIDFPDVTNYKQRLDFPSLKYTVKGKIENIPLATPEQRREIEADLKVVNALGGPNSTTITLDLPDALPEPTTPAAETITGLRPALRPYEISQLEREIASGHMYGEVLRAAIDTQAKIDNEPLLLDINEALKWIVANAGGYKRSIDPDLLCQKSYLTDIALRYIKDQLGSKYKGDYGWELLRRAEAAGLPTPCVQCYLVSARTSKLRGNQKLIRYGVAPYKRQLRKMKAATVEFHQTVTLLRHYSSTDGKPEHLPGLLVSIVDAAERGIPIGGYSKDLDTMEILAPTGAYFNLSIGRDKRVSLDDVDRAKALRKKYPNLSIVYVAFNDEEIIEAAQKDWIDHIIPWHASAQSRESLGIRLGDPTIQDYTKVQNETVWSDKSRRWLKAKDGNIPEAEHRGDVRRYLRLAKQRGVRIKFPQLFEAFEKRNQTELYMKLIGPEYGKFSLTYTPYAPPVPKFNLDKIDSAIAKRVAFLKSGSNIYMGIAKKITMQVKNGTFELSVADDPFTNDGSALRYDNLATPPRAAIRGFIDSDQTRDESVAGPIEKPLDTITNSDISSYLEREEIDPDELASATTDQSRRLAEIQGASSEAYPVSRKPEDLQDGPGVAAPVPGSEDASRRAFEGISGAGIAEDASQRFEEAFAQSDTISAIVHDRFKGINMNPKGVRGIQIASPRDAASLALMIRSPYQEVFKAIYLDKNDRVLSMQALALGALTESSFPVHEIFRQAPAKTKALILAHNHPSGRTTPSGQDIAVTHDLRTAAEVAGVIVKDHIITDHGSFTSMSVEKILPEWTSANQGEVSQSSGRPAPETSAELAAWESVPLGTIIKISDSGDAKRLSEALRQGAKDFGHAILLNANNRVIAIHRFGTKRDPSDVAKDIGKVLAYEPATGMILEGDEISAELASKVRLNAKALSVQLVDVLTGDGSSWRAKGIGPVGLFISEDEAPIYLDKPPANIITKPRSEIDGQDGYYDRSAHVIVIADDLSGEERAKAIRHEQEHVRQDKEGRLPRSTYASPIESIRQFMQYFTDPSEVAARFAAEGKSQAELDDFLAELEWARSDDAAQYHPFEVVDSAVAVSKRKEMTSQFVARELQRLKTRNRRGWTADAIDRASRSVVKSGAPLVESIHLGRIFGSRGEPTLWQEIATDIDLSFQNRRLGVTSPALRPDEIETISQPVLKLKVRGKLRPDGSRQRINPIIIESRLRDAGIEAFAPQPDEIHIPLTESNIERVRYIQGMIDANISEPPRELRPAVRKPLKERFEEMRAKAGRMQKNLKDAMAGQQVGKKKIARLEGQNRTLLENAAEADDQMRAISEQAESSRIAAEAGEKTIGKLRTSLDKAKEREQELIAGRVALQAKIAELRKKKADQMALVGATQDYINQVLDPEDRVPFIRKLWSVLNMSRESGEAFTDRIIEETEKLARSNELSFWRTKVMGLVRKLRKRIERKIHEGTGQTIDARYAENILDIINRYSDMKPSQIDQINETIRDRVDANIDDMPFELAQQYLEAAKPNFYMMTQEELQETYEELSRLAELGRTKQQKREALKKMRRQREQTVALNAIRNAMTPEELRQLHPTISASEAQKRLLSLRERMIKAPRAYASSLLRLDTILHDLEGWDPERPLSKLIVDRIQQWNNDYYLAKKKIPGYVDHIRGAIDIQDSMRKMVIKDMPIRVYDDILWNPSSGRLILRRDQQDIVDSAGRTEKDLKVIIGEKTTAALLATKPSDSDPTAPGSHRLMGDNVPPQDIVSWTESEAMAIVALSKEPTGYAHLVGTGLTDNQIKAIEDSLSPEARAAIERWFEIANEQGKRIKDAAYVHKNIIVPLLQNYFPVRGVVTTKSADAMLSALFSAGEFGKGIESGMLKARTGSRSALRSFDFWRTIMDSMVVAERYITGIGPMGEIRSVLANKNIVAAMKAKSPQLYRDLMDHIERVASGRLPSAGGPIATVFDQLSSRAAAATILLNLRSIMVQPVSGITALARLSPSQVPYYMRAIAQMAASPISMTEETRKMSPYMERRPSNLERDLAEMTRIKYVEGLFGKHFSLEQAQEATAIFQKAFDAAVTVPLFRGVYDHYIDTHKSEMTSPKAEQRIRTEAEHAAERAVIDSQSQGELSWLSNMAAGDALHRAFTRYISELIAVQNMVFEWYRNPNKATIKKMMEATLISLGALLVFVIQKGHWPSDWEDAVAAIGSQYTGGIPIFGAMADYVTQKMLGLKPTWYDVSPVGADTIRDIAQGTGKLMAGDYKKGAAQTIEGIAEARGVPGVNGFKRLIRGWDKFSKTHDARYLAYPEREIDEARRSN